MTASGYRLEVTVLELINQNVRLLPSIDKIRRGVDECLASGVPVIVTNRLGRELGRVTKKGHDQYLWARTTDS